jgi:hypothetical protein
MYAPSVAARSALSNRVIFHGYMVACTRTRGYFSFYIKEENPYKPPLYGTWLCDLNEYNDTLYIRILMKFCNLAFLETIIGSLTCGTASPTDVIMEELG